MAFDDITPEEFVRTRMSHNGYEEYFKSIEVNPDNYRPTLLSITHIEKLVTDDFSLHAELKLASERAIPRRCEFVTNLDYCQFNPDEGSMILAGTGWIAKERK